MDDGARGGPVGADSPAAGEERARAIAPPVLTDALAVWRRELAGLGGPEPLMSFRDLHEGSLDLSTAHPSGIAMFLAGRPTRLSHMFREPGVLGDTRRRARAIRQAAAALSDEHGLRACVLAVGLASWRDAETGDVVSTPVLLRPLELRPRGSGQVDYELDLGGAVRTNPALVRELQRRGVAVDPQALAALAGHQHGFDPTPTLERLRTLTRLQAPGVEIRTALLVTALVDVAPALVAELDRSAAALAECDVALALAGDPAARVRLQEQDAALPPAAPGDGSAAADLRVLALDPHQRRVLDAVLAGASLRVEAGPGTGATQLVAAAVAALAGSGRRVLLVPGQQVEAEDVARRLAGLGLADLVGDPAGALDARATGPLARVHAEPERLARPDRDPAAELRAHHRALHAVREPWGVSALDALHALTALEGPPTGVRLSALALRQLDAQACDQAAEQLAEAIELGALTVHTGDSPWAGASLTRSEDAAAALSTVRALHDHLVPSLRAQAAALAAASGLRAPQSVVECADQLQLLTAVREDLDLFTPAVFERPLDDLLDATASSSDRGERGVRMGILERRRLERAARELLRPGVLPQDLHAALAAAEASRRAWTAWQDPEAAGLLPAVPQGVPAAEVACTEVVDHLAWLQQVLAPTAGGGDLLATPWEALLQRLETLAGDDSALVDLPRRTSLVRQLRARGLGPLLEDLRERQVPAQDAPRELLRVWWRSVLDAVLAEEPVLAGLDPGRRAEVVAALAADERRRVAAAVRRVRDATALAGAPPCRVCSPLALPHDVPPSERQDVVVLVAAHRTGVPEAVLAVASARQVVVVGDPGGLPPAPVAPRPGTTAVSSRDSVFSALAGVLPTLELDHQHRMPAQLAELARLVPGARTGSSAVPAAPGSAAARLDLVAEPTGRPDEEGVVESPEGEVARVVELVTEHARTRPSESLAVIALTRPHARRIADALRAVLPERPDLARYLSGADAGQRGLRPPEPFVVTDVERCADTVRDAVVVSVGFGITPLGRFVHRLGPLDEPEGHRRLAVALTRARLRLTVVSCVAGSALDEGRLRSDGGLALRRVLLALEAADAAARAGAERARAGGSDVHPLAAEAADPLLARLAQRLSARGLRARPGASVPDLVVQPGRGESPAVAVITDLPDAPDDADPGAGGDLLHRELLLPEELARFGWRTVRLGAVDLFADPDAAARRVQRELEAVRPSSPASGPVVPDEALLAPPGDGAAAAEQEPGAPVPAGAEEPDDAGGGPLEPGPDGADPGDAGPDRLGSTGHGQDAHGQDGHGQDGHGQDGGGAAASGQVDLTVGSADARPSRESVR